MQAAIRAAGSLGARNAPKGGPFKEVEPCFACAVQKQSAAGRRMHIGRALLTKARAPKTGNTERENMSL